MCGIAGAWQLHYSEFNAQRTDILRALAHRGPDATGFYVSPDGQVGLAHTRLSIIDLSSDNNQPFETEHTVVVFNGEIYNYRQLRNELLERGAVFRTQGDTEVMARGFEFWGMGVFQRLQGMYAAGLWDKRSRRLYLARDMFGIKPLYWQRRNGEIRFGSEIKALAAGQQLRMNDNILLDLASFGYPFESSSVFDGIEHAPPGTVLQIRAEHGRFLVETHRTKRLDDFSGGDREPLLETLRASVADHLIADVPVAVALSGGLDSSAITVLAHELKADIEALTNTFDDPGDQEIAFASELCQHHRIRHTIVHSEIPEPGLFLRAVSWHLEEPVPNIALLTSYFLAAALRKRQCKVILLGEGADELFAGYPWHRFALEPGLRDNPVGLFEAYESRRSAGDHLSKFLTPNGAKLLAERRAFQRERFVREFGEHDGSALTRFLFFEMKYQLQYAQLIRVDRMYMAHSVEARVPFLYDLVLRAALARPDSDKIRRQPLGAVGRWLFKGNEKICLRRAIQPLVPRRISGREKFGPRGTVNLFDTAAGKTLRSLFHSVAREERHAAARETVEHLIDWKRAADPGLRLSPKAQLFLGLLCGSAEHFVLGTAPSAAARSSTG